MARTILAPQQPTTFPTIAPAGPQEIPGGGYQRIQAEPASFGGMIGGAGQQAGREIEAGGAALGQAAMSRQDLYNQIAADKATTDYMTGVHKLMFGDPTAKEGDPAQVGLLGMDGPGAMAAARDMPGKLDDLRNQIASQQPNNYVREAFNSETRRQRIYVDQQIGSHYATQMDRWGKKVQDDRIDSAATGAGLNYTDPEQLRQNYSQITDAAVKQVTHDIGGPIDPSNPDHQNALQRALAAGYTKFAKNIVDAAIAHKQPEVGDKLLRDWEPWLGLPGEVQRGLYESLRTPLIRSEGDAAANAIISGRPYTGTGGGAAGGTFRAPAGPHPFNLPIASATADEQRMGNEIRYRESGGNYSAPPNETGASGAYQFRPDTWKETTAKTGIGTEFDAAYKAPKEVQDANFLYKFRHEGTGPWRASGPYPGAGGTAVATGVNQDLHAALDQAFKEILPPGYRAEPTSGVRHGDPRSQHDKGNAEDWQIYRPDNNPVPNKGEDSTGFYEKAAVRAYQILEQKNPDLAEKFAWGGHFGTEIGGGGPPDLMHYDLGGPRGRYGDPTRTATLAHATPAAGAPPGGGPGSTTGTVTSATQPIWNPQTLQYEQRPRPTQVAENTIAPVGATDATAPAATTTEAPATAPPPSPAPAAAPAPAQPAATPAIPPLAPIIQEHQRALEALNNINFSSPEAEDHARRKVNEHFTMLEEQNRALAADQERQRVLEQKDRTDRERKAADSIVSRLLDDPTKVPATEISQNPDLTTPGMKENLHNLQKSRLHEIANPEEIKDYGSAFHDLWQRVHAPAGDPNRITDPQVIYDHAKVGGDLGVAGADYLVKDIFGRRTEQGENEQTLRNHFLITARGKITGSDEGMHLKDPKGDELYQKFLGYFLPAYEKARRGTDKEPGKTPEQLLTPGSPDYLGNVLDQPDNAYVRPMDQWFKDTVADRPAATTLAPADLANPDALKAAVAKNPALRDQAIAEARKRGWIAAPPPAQPAPPLVH